MATIISKTIHSQTVKPQLSFKRKIENDTQTFLGIKTIPQLSRFLNLSLEELKNIVEYPAYVSFSISKKNGGCRTIHSPEEKLKKAQKKINTHLQSLYYLTKSPQSHGFVIQNKSLETKPNIYMNALPHVGNKFLLNVDIKDFFGSISASKINKLFLSDPFCFDIKISETLALLCTYQKFLPQGSPTSPVLSNFVCQDLDRDIQLWAKAKYLVYTRYADDITFSSQHPFSIQHLEEIDRLISIYGFKLNPRKSRMTSENKKMQVTGLVVNKKINVDRKYIRRIRAMLHDLEKNGLDIATKNHFLLNKTDKVNHDFHQRFIQHLRGSLAFVGQIRGTNDAIFQRYFKQLSRLLNKQKQAINPST